MAFALAYGLPGPEARIAEGARLSNSRDAARRFGIGPLQQASISKLVGLLPVTLAILAPYRAGPI